MTDKTMTFSAAGINRTGKCFILVNKDLHFSIFLVIHCSLTHIIYVNSIIILNYIINK